MTNADKSKNQLLHELEMLHARVAELEKAEAKRKQAEEILRESEECYRALGESTLEGITITENGIIIDSNDRFAEIVGYEPDEIINKPARDFVFPEDLDLVSHNIRAGYEHIYEHQVLKKNGSVIVVEVHGKSIRYRGCPARITIIRDITERKKVENALRESEERFRTIFDFAPVGVVILDEDASVLQANQEMEEILGYSDDEFRGMSVADFTHPEDAAASMELIRALRERESKAGQIEKRYLHKDGRSIWANTAIAPICDTNGELQYFVTMSVDITARKEAEEAMRWQRDRAENYLDVAGVMMLVIDADQTVSLINKKGCAILGVGEDEIVGKNWFDNFIPKHDIDRVKAVFASLMAGKIQSVEYVESRILTGTRETRLIAWHNSVLSDSSGTIIGTLSSGEDITERKQAEEKFAIAFRSSPSGIIITTIEGGRFVDANDSFLRMIGYDRKEVIGRSVAELNIWPDLEQRDYLVQALQERGQAHNYELSIRHKSGELRSILTSAEIIDLLGTPCLLAITTDISDRKQAEEALRESEDRYRALFENAPIGIAVSDPRIRTVMQNDALEQIYGYSMEELNQIDQYVTYINPEDRDHLLKRLKQDGFLRAFEVAKKRRDGTVYYVNITMVPFPTMGEGYYLTMLVDITERKKTEQQLRALTARLAEVETAERKRLARELHDQVGQSLTALGINLNIAKAQMPGEGMNLARSRLDDALALVKSTTQSIRDVMNDLRPPMLDAYGLLETLQWYGEQFAARTMIDVVVQGEEPNPRFPAMVENSLFRIVQEALINTAKHAGAQQVIVVVNERDDTLRLTIIDDGIGFNAHKSIQPTDQQGWGLLIMTERAEGIGGQFNLQSSLGEGTKITVEVPR